MLKHVLLTMSTIYETLGHFSYVLSFGEVVFFVNLNSKAIVGHHRMGLLVTITISYISDDFIKGYVNFAADQPSTEVDLDCFVMTSANNYKWSTGNCNIQYPFICMVGEFFFMDISKFAAVCIILLTMNAMLYKLHPLRFHYILYRLVHL